MSEEKPKHHQANVIRVGEIKKHPNADTLSLITVDGFQVVIKSGEFNTGDLAVYVTPDSIVPEIKPFEFLWEDKVQPGEDIPYRYRRVTARKFRGEWSEGLLLPVTDFLTEFRNYGQRNNIKSLQLPEGLDVSDILGITHYEPQESLTESNEKQHGPRSFKGWVYYFFYITGFFHLLNALGFKIKYNLHLRGNLAKPPENNPQVYNVEALKKNLGVFETGEQVVVTEKIHGSNARYQFDGEKMHVGSHETWKRLDGKKTIWHQVLEQQPWIEEWCRAFPGYTLYGEVVPTQRFKSGKVLNYGTYMPSGKTDVFKESASSENQTTARFFLFDILTPEGTWLSFSELFGPCYSDIESRELCMNYVGPGHEDFDLSNQFVPVLYVGPFDVSLPSKFVDGKSQVGDTDYLREGIVIRSLTERRVPGRGRVQFKQVSNQFLVLT